MIVKKNWNDLLYTSESQTTLLQRIGDFAKEILAESDSTPTYDIGKLIAKIDELYASKTDEDISISLKIKQAFIDMFSLYFGITYTNQLVYNKDNVIWKDLPIYLSSYKLGDYRIANTIRDKIIQYLSWYYKVLSDDGVAGKVAISKTYSNSGSSNGSDKDMNAETPQLELGSITNFDNDMINYASSLSKNERSNSMSNSGSSSQDMENVNWNEMLKNLRMVYNNDLLKFINDIPAIMFNYYTLETMPYPALIKEYIKHNKNIWDVEK